MKKRICTSLTVLALTCLLVIPLFAQTGSQVAIITVSGSGKTQDEAKQNALRNAIEQAFGTFISSNTQILNDELIKDEIVSVSSGNIQEYSVISEVQTPDGYWSNTLKAKVSIEKLTSFCESKGVIAEFKGSLFALNIKQQLLNEQNELKAIENMRVVLNRILERSFDYTITASQPTSYNNSWKIPVTVEGTLNNNFINVSNYLFNTLRGLSCNQSEVDNYITLKKELYFVAYKPMGVKDKDAGLFVLRNEKSLDEIKALIDDLKEAFLNFSIDNGIENPNMNSLNLSRYGDSYRYESASRSIERIAVKSIEFRPVLTKWDIIRPNESNFLQYGSYKYGLSSPQRDNSRNYDPYSISNYDLFENYIGKYFSFLKNWDFLYDMSGKSSYTNYIAISFSNLIVGKSKGIFSFDNIYTVEQIQKISEYKISPNYK